MHNTVITWQQFKRKRNEVTREIRYAKLNYQNKKIDQINSGNIHVKEWYKLTKQLFNKQSSTTIPILKYEGKTASDDIEKVNLLNTVSVNKQRSTHNLMTYLQTSPVRIQDFYHLLYPLQLVYINNDI